MIGLNLGSAPVRSGPRVRVEASRYLCARHKQYKSAWSRYSSRYRNLVPLVVGLSCPSALHGFFLARSNSPHPLPEAVDRVMSTRSFCRTPRRAQAASCNRRGPGVNNASPGDFGRFSKLRFDAAFGRRRIRAQTFIAASIHNRTANLIG